MDKKSLLFGLGVGIIAVSLLLFVVLGISGGAVEEKQPVSQSLSDEEIIERAGRLGMVMVKDLPEASSVVSGPVELTDAEIIEKARGLGMVMDSPAPIDDEEIIERAKELGYVLLEDIINQGEMEEPIAPLQSEPLVEDDEEASVKEGYKRIVVESGESSQSISELLFNNGIVEDAGEFNRFVTSQGKSTRLVAGTYDIPDGATHDEILEMLTKARVVTE